MNQNQTTFAKRSSSSDVLAPIKDRFEKKQIDMEVFFKAWYMYAKPWLNGWVVLGSNYRYLSDEVVKDAIQEAAVKLIQEVNLNRLQEIDNLTAWTKTVLVREYWKLKEPAMQWVPYDSILAEETPAPSSGENLQLLMEKLTQSIGALPDGKEKALFSRMLELNTIPATMEDLAEILGVSAKTLSRYKKWVQQILENKNGESP